MSLRTIKNGLNINPETLEPEGWIIVLRNNIPLIVKSFMLESDNNRYKSLVLTDYHFKVINTLLVETGESPLSKEEIFYYKLTKDC